MAVPAVSLFSEVDTIAAARPTMDFSDSPCGTAQCAHTGNNRRRIRSRGIHLRSHIVHGVAHASGLLRRQLHARLVDGKTLPGLLSRDAVGNGHLGCVVQELLHLLGIELAVSSVGDTGLGSGRRDLGDIIRPQSCALGYGKNILLDPVLVLRLAEFGNLVESAQLLS